MEAGNFFDGYQPPDRLKNRLILEVMNSIGVRAANVADLDLIDGLKPFRQSMEPARFPLISSSFRYADDGKPLFQESVLLEVEGIRIGVTGINRKVPEFQIHDDTGRSVGIIAPLEAVDEALEDLRDKSDLIIILAHVKKETAEEILRFYPEVDYIMATYGADLSGSVAPEGNARIQYAGDKGRFIIETRLTIGKDKSLTSRRTFLHYLSEAYPYNLKVRQAVEQVDAQVKGIHRNKLEETMERQIAAQGRDEHFVTAKKCQSCHKESYKIWIDSHHAYAYRNLPSDKRKDENCLKCHVTGHGHKGGFGGIVSTPHLLNVQCEACHQAGGKHALDPKGSPMGPVAPWICRVCHDGENSPEFDHAKYLEKIKH
ncbi:multiheme c-type cytochrome [Acidobacteriota bacterium]